MSKFVLTNVRTFAGGYDLSADTNEVTISANRAQMDVTNYNSQGWKESIAGLGQAKFAITGQYEAGSGGLSDDALSLSGANFATAGGVTVCPLASSDQSLAYLTNAVEFDFAMFTGKVGSVADFKADASSTWPLVRGIIACPPSNVITSTGTGTINAITGPTASQQFYADVHIISVSGSPTITFTIQSAALVGFGSPTTRLTFVAATGIGGQILRVPGAISDGFWRAQWTVSGSGSVQAAVSFGVA